jgi:hypothetical protein
MKIVVLAVPAAAAVIVYARAWLPAVTVTCESPFESVVVEVALSVPPFAIVQVTVAFTIGPPDALNARTTRGAEVWPRATVCALPLTIAVKAAEGVSLRVGAVTRFGLSSSPQAIMAVVARTATSRRATVDRVRCCIGASFS